MIQKVYPQHILYFTYLFNCGSKADTQISPLLSVLSTASPPCYYLRTDYPAHLTLISCILAAQLCSRVSGCQQAFPGVQAVYTLSFLPGHFPQLAWLFSFLCL